MKLWLVLPRCRFCKGEIEPGKEYFPDTSKWPDGYTALHVQHNDSRDCLKHLEEKKMKILTLKRISLRSDGVYGVLLDEDKTPFCLSLERPWHNNEKEVSCIPKGEYIAKRALYRSKYDSFLLQDVPGRDGIFIHRGNWITNTKGCILLGESFAVMVNPETKTAENSVASTGEAFNEFMTRMAGEDTFRLVVVEV